MNNSNTFSFPIVIRGNSPFAKIDVNGHELTFLVDCGAGLSVYDKKYIGYLGINENQLGEVVSDISGIGDNSFNGRMGMMFFTIADMKFANPFSITELGNTFRAFKESLGEVAGIIGGDFLYNYEAIIDYGAREIRIDKAKIISLMDAIWKQSER